jgi:hypothetical protein
MPSCSGAPPLVQWLAGMMAVLAGWRIHLEMHHRGGHRFAYLLCRHRPQRQGQPVVPF